MYIGWYRETSRGPWQKLVEADDLGECHHLLLLATPPDMPSLNRCITAGGAPAGGRREDETTKEMEK